MAKYYGLVGYLITEETRPNVFTEKFVERPYYGDISRASRRLENSSNINDNVAISHTISIVADAYAFEHYFAIRYAELHGQKWKVSNIEVTPPRLQLTLGEIFND